MRWRKFSTRPKNNRDIRPFVRHYQGEVMYRTVEDFLLDWENESSATMKILHSLTNGSLNLDGS